MPKKIVKRQEQFRCKTCKTDYETFQEAAECEKRSLEKVKFNVGDKAKNILEPRTCSSGERPTSLADMS